MRFFIDSELGAEVAGLVIEHNLDSIEERIVLILNRIEQVVTEVLRELQANLRAAVDAIGIGISVIIAPEIIHAIDRQDMIVLVQHDDTALDVRQGGTVDDTHLVVHTFGALDNKRELLLRQRRCGK